MAEAGIRVAVLGPLVVRDPLGNEVLLPGTRLSTLVIRLALAGGRPVARQRLIDDVWGDTATPANPLNAVQALVSRLRRLAPQLPVDSTLAGYALGVGPEAVDLWRFEELTALGREQLPDRPDLAAATLRRALELWRGEAFPEAAGAPFTLAPATHARELRWSALAARIDADLAVGRAAQTVPELERLAAAAPTDERWATRLMLALRAAGRQADALEVYGQTRRALAELGIDCSQELADIHLAVLRGEPAPGGPARRGAAAPAVSVRTGAPARLTACLGREAELARVAALLAERRQVTLVGPGGIGKTRLATEAAHVLADRFDDGVRWVNLAELRYPDRVAQSVLDALEPGGPAVLSAPAPAVGATRERLAALIGDRRLLLVLDNCEHLLDAVAGLGEELLAACPGVRVLATSREPLAVAGEAVLPLGPLPVPPFGAAAAEVAASPAVRLLAERTREIRPSFAADAANAADLARICRRLDGLPLALELAAARLRALSPAQIAARLEEHFRLLTADRRGYPARHRTLDAVVAWSWELLGAEERLVARRLAVFAGGATLEAAERVCSAPRAGVAPERVLDLVTALVDKSLVFLDETSGQARYRMLGSIREYLREQLPPGEGEAVRAAHARYFLELAESAEWQLLGADQVVWLGRLRAEQDNLQAALYWSVEAGEGALAVRMVAALGWYWFLSGQQIEAAERAARALSVAGEDTPADARALVLIMSALAPAATAHPVSEAMAGIRQWMELARHTRPPGAPERPELAAFQAMLHMLDQDPAGALDAMDRLTREANPWTRACGHLNCGHLHAVRGDADTARHHYRAALREARAAGERWAQIQALSALAEIAATAEGPGEAAQLLEDALHLAVELGALEDQVTIRARLGGERARGGDMAGGRGELERALETARRFGITRCVPRVRWALADVVRWQGDPAGAAAVLAGGPAASGTTGWPDAEQLALTLCGQGHIDVAERRTASAAERYAEAMTHALHLGDPRLIAAVARLGADIAQEHGYAERAMGLLGVGDGLTGRAGRTHPDTVRIRARCADLAAGPALEAAYRAGTAAAAAGPEAWAGRLAAAAGR
ncbi:BTAD domain-containing putative transcriptional regulator [Streptomyces sp. NPDC023838]|uniref:BTAD domain-containing putative transcriptional regulator n=1 Tax=Streptomyces sp. NPDC023838 TaxID=3154325 RepID=UPI0033F7FD7A